MLHCTVDALTLLFAAIGLALGIPVAGSIHTDVDKILRSLRAAEWAIKVGWALEAADSRLLDACATTSNSYKEVLVTLYVCFCKLLRSSLNWMRGRGGSFRGNVCHAVCVCESLPVVNSSTTVLLRSP